jgi:hypothetical protein
VEVFYIVYAIIVILGHLFDMLKQYVENLRLWRAWRAGRQGQREPEVVVEEAEMGRGDLAVEKAWLKVERGRLEVAAREVEVERWALELERREAGTERRRLVRLGGRSLQPIPEGWLPSPRGHLTLF